MSKIKLRFTLAIFLVHMRMFQVYNNIFIFPKGNNPLWDISRSNFSPHGFPHVFFLQGIHHERNLFNGKVFSAFIHIYIVFGMDSAQLLHVVVKQAGNLYFRFTWSHT